jgi:sulfur-carrier protein adenylyltransferase/sulfurtransferase
MVTATVTTVLSVDELQRYSRHLSLPHVGLEGQERLKRASVLLIGAGGLGSPAALYLAAAGVGRLGIVDFDAVDVTNLQRQILHGTADLGRPKVESARERLRDINPHVEVDAIRETLSSANALDLLRPYDVIVDGTDNFPTRYLVNDACVLLGKPNVYGSIFRFEGQASVFSAGDGPCYRCLFREPPPPGLVPSCAEGGVFGVLPGFIGVVQATETIKLLIGIGEPLIGRLLLFDALRMSVRTIRLQRDPECPACGTREITELIDYDAFCGVSAKSGDARDSLGSGAAMVGVELADWNPVDGEVTPRAVAARLARGEVDLIDVREPYEYAIARIDGARLIPLNSIPAAAGSIDRERDVVVYCHHGMRSQMAIDYLRGLGFTRLFNLEGGIARWSEDVDATVPSY